MREILFRGKRLDNGEWVDGHLVRAVDYLDETEHCFIVADAERFPRNEFVGFHEVDTETVGQYTVLRDKNGKRIFEGDILDHYAQSDIIVNRGVVFWDEKNARWAHKLKSMNPCFYMYKSEAFEVVGNIHDNPELMEGAKRD